MNAFHEILDGDDPLSGSSDRNFGLVFAAVFTLIGVLPLLSGEPPRGMALVSAAVFALLAFLRPGWLHLLNRGWMRLGAMMSRVMNPVILGILFFGVVLPTGLFLRLIGKDLLRLRFDRQARSYWIDREVSGPVPESLTHQF